MSKQLGWKGVAEGRANPLIDSWQPTFHMCPNRALIVAVEVADVIFPEILKIAAHDIERFNASISVYQACALDIYLADPRLARARAAAHERRAWPGLDLIIPDITKACPMFFPWSIASARKAPTGSGGASVR